MAPFDGEYHTLQKSYQAFFATAVTFSEKLMFHICDLEYLRQGHGTMVPFGGKYRSV